jgi:nitrate/nitrite transporter NarK
MLITAATFIALSFLPYDFDYLPFAVILFVMGLGGGMFASPNIASIMNSVPPEHRGAASGMRATLQNTGQTVSLAIFFTVIITGLSSSLPSALTKALTTAGVPQLAQAKLNSIPPTSALFAAFLGSNPMGAMLSAVQTQFPSIYSLIPSSTVSYLTNQTFFPNAIAPAFMSSLQLSFYIGAALSLVAAAASLLRGKKYIHEVEQAKEMARKQEETPAPLSGA